MLTKTVWTYYRNVPDCDGVAKPIIQGFYLSREEAYKAREEDKIWREQMGEEEVAHFYNGICAMPLAEDNLVEALNGALRGSHFHYP